MPAVDKTFSFNDGVALDGTISTVTLDRFDGGGITLIAIGTQSTQGPGGIKGAHLQETISVADDLDLNGTNDLVDAVNQAASELSLSINAAQFRNLILRFAQIAVANKRVNDGA